jgi:hypothetical protein
MDMPLDAGENGFTHTGCRECPQRDDTQCNLAGHRFVLTRIAWGEHDFQTLVSQTWMRGSNLGDDWGVAK